MMGTMAPLSVWWDLRTCPLFVEIDLSLLALRMQSVFLEHGLSPAIDTFSAYADASHVPFSRQKALVDAGIRLHHTPQGKTGIKGFAMVVDMLLWVLEHPAPANIVVITSNIELGNSLHKLRMKCYNIILITPQLDLKSSLSLTKAATLVLTWPSLHILPEAMQHQVSSFKSSTLFVDDSSMTKVDKNKNSNASRKRPPEQDATKPGDMINLRKRRIRDRDSLKRTNLNYICMLPPSNASQEKKEEQQGMINEELLELQEVTQTEKGKIMQGPTQTIKGKIMPGPNQTEKGNKMQEPIQIVTGKIIQEPTQIVNAKEVGTANIPLIEPINRGKAEKRRIDGCLKQLADNSPKSVALGSPYMCPPPNASEKKKAEQQGAKESLILATFKSWLQNLMQTKKAAKGIRISCLEELFRQESGMTEKLRNLLGGGRLSASLLKFPYILRIKHRHNDLYAFPVTSQKANRKASQAKKVKVKGTTHISLIESSESENAKKGSTVESLKQLAGNSPKRAALGSYMPPPSPINASQKKNAEQKGTMGSIEFELWLQSCMQTKKAAKGISISLLENVFMHETSIKQGLQEYLGGESLSVRLLKFPHIIRLERRFSEVLAFPVIEIS